MMNRIQNLFRRNLPAKILALLGAVVLWFFVMNEQNPSVNSTFTVPIYTVNEPAGYTVKLSVSSVTVKVRAPRASLTATKADDFKAYVDLAEAVEGTNTIKVRTVVPQGFEVVDISDDTVDVTMESIIDKQLPVDIQVTGNTGARSVLDKIIADTNYVVVSGPRSHVDRVTRVVGYLNLANNTADFRVHVKLTPVDDNGSIVDSVTLATSEVDVTAKILSGVDKKVLPIKPVYRGTPDKAYVVAGTSVKPDKVEITGKVELLEKLADISTEPVVIEEAKADVIKEVNLVLPDGIISPSKEVTVKVQIKKKNDN